MNKQVNFIVIVGVAVIGFIGLIVLTVLKPGSEEMFADYIFQLVAILAIYGGLSYQQNKQSEVLKKVDKQTNGALDKLTRENEELRALLADQKPRTFLKRETDSIRTVEYSDEPTTPEQKFFERLHNMAENSDA